MNLANKITMARILVIPVFVVIAFLNIRYANVIAAAIFIVASLTDQLDGYIARARKQITTFGKFLDPLADKLLITAALIALVGKAKIPAWIATVIISREFIVTGVRLVAAGEGKIIAASMLGRVKNYVQVIAVILALIEKDASSVLPFLVPYDGLIHITTVVMLGAAVVITIYSCIDYLVKNKDIITAGIKV